MCRCTRTSLHQARSSPPERASRPTASSSSWLTSASALNSVLDQALDLVEQDARRVDRLLDPRERVDDPGDRVELAVAHADELFCFTRASAAHHDAGGLAPAPQEDQRRDERDERGHERRPDVAADRRAVVQHLGREDPGRDPDRGKDRRQPDVGDGHPAPLAPERRRERCGHHQVRARQDEQRDSVEVDSLVFGAHWALGMIRRPPGGVEDSTRFPDRKAPPCDLERWAGRPIGIAGRPGLAWLALGDASRGALYLALWPAASTWGEPVATTPRAAGSLRSDTSRRVRRCAGRAGPRARTAPRARARWRRRARPRSGRPEMKPRPASTVRVSGLTVATPWIQPCSSVERHVDRREEEHDEDRELHHRAGLHRPEPHRHAGRPEHRGEVQQQRRACRGRRGRRRCRRRSSPPASATVVSTVAVISQRPSAASA